MTMFYWGLQVEIHLHGDTHSIAEIDDDEGDDGQPLLLREGCHDGPEASLAATKI